MKHINQSTLHNLIIELKFKDRNDPFFKRGLDRIVRDITQRNQTWPMTPLLKEKLIEHGLYKGDEMKNTQMKSISKKLKSFIQDEIMIEHWKEVSDIKQELCDMELPGNIEDAMKQVENYLIENTDCFFKLTNSESGLEKRKGVVREF